jgi:protocatechuate 3,4-dioxygenase beta subunit
MRHWARDVLLTRRGLIACAAGLVVAKAVPAGMTPTPAQTAGPFYPRTKPDDTDADLTQIEGARARASGEIIEVSGRILSVKGHALLGAVVEIWQADMNGRYYDPRDWSLRTSRDRNFQGYGAVRAGADGAYRFRTVRPAPYNTGVTRRTPHIHFRVTGKRLGELVTQMYFPGEPLNAQDFIFSSLSGDLARDAATARFHPGGDMPRYTYDLVLA